MFTNAPDGQKVWYRVAGEGSPILLLNGWGGSSDSWSPEMVGLLAAAHRVVTVDNRGTGRSGKPDEPYTMEAMAGDAVAALDAAGVGRAHVLGFSMGGILAQAVAVYHPARVKSLILCATSTGGRSRVPRDPSVAAELVKIGDPPPGMTERDVTVALLRLLYPRGYVEENLKALVAEETYTDHPTPAYALRRQSEAIAGFDAYDELPSLDVPALVMAGGEDQLTPPENSRILAARLRDAELVVLPGPGHGFLKQDTRLAVRHILAFTSRVDGGD